MQLAVLREAVDVANLLALDLDRERRARIHRASIDDHRAGAARAAIAPALVAGHWLVEMHAQRIEQCRARLDLETNRLAVDVQRHRYGAGADCVDRGLCVGGGSLREYTGGRDTT